MEVKIVGKLQNQIVKLRISLKLKITLEKFLKSREREARGLGIWNLSSNLQRGSNLTFIKDLENKSYMCYNEKMLQETNNILQSNMS